MIDNKYLFELRAVGGPRPVIAAGPITKQRMTICYRIELCDLGTGGFVVCPHYLDIPPNGCPIHKSYGHGDYFKKEELEQAVLRFGRRVMMDAEHVSSVLSDQEKTNKETDVASVPPSVPDEDTAEFSHGNQAVS